MIMYRKLDNKLIGDIESGLLDGSVIIQDKLTPHHYHEYFMDTQNSVILYDRIDINLPKKWSIINARDSYGVSSFKFDQLERSICSICSMITKSIHKEHILDKYNQSQSVLDEYMHVIRFVHDLDLMIKWRPSHDFMMSMILFVSNIGLMLPKSTIGRVNLSNKHGYSISTINCINLVVFIIEYKLKLSMPSSKYRITRKNPFKYTLDYVDSYMSSAISYLGKTEFTHLFSYESKAEATANFFRISSFEYTGHMHYKKVYSSIYYKNIISPL